MERIIAIFVVLMTFSGHTDNQADITTDTAVLPNPTAIAAQDIVAAKDYVRMCIPEKVEFDETKTKVTETHVYLTFTVEDALGARDQHTYGARRDTVKNRKP